MRVLSPTALLAAWDEGASQLLPARAVTLLALAFPEKTAAEWAVASIGERDRRLLQLREELFGLRLEATAACPACGERLELGFGTRGIAIPSTPAAEERLWLETSGYEVSYRLPTTADLMAAAAMEDPRELLRRCVERAWCGGTEVAPTLLPDDVASAVSAGVAQADPMAEVQIPLKCPTCSHEWSCVFDIVSFLWGEIEDWVQRIMHEVHILASAYGWSERDIVAMSPRRRRVYLNIVGAR